MTIKPSGSLSLSEINDEFGLGTDLGAYLGVRWYLDNAATGTFSASNVSISEFYSKRATSPVTPGSTTISSSQNFTVPIYSVLTVVLRGGSGGGAGGSGNGAFGNSGGPGTSSSFGSFGSADFGRGGAPGGYAGASGYGSDGSPAGGAGGAGGGVGGTYGGAGGAGGKTILTLTNPIVGGTGPAVGSSVYVTVGSAGYGGAGGSYYIYVNGYPAWYPCGSGFYGSNGWVEISWA